MSNELTYPQGFIDAINNISTSAPPFAFIHVNYPVGSTCYAESTDGDYLAAQNTDGEYTFVLPEPVMDEATWTVSCSNGTDSDSVDIVINSYQQIENITLKYIDPVLNNNSWKAISAIAQRGIGDSYWDIGDCKAITLNGQIGSYLTLNNYATYVFILDFNHPVNKSTVDNNIIFGGFKTLENKVDVCLCDSGYGTSTARTSGIWFTMNHVQVSKYIKNSNYGGWKGCDFRYDILGAVQTAPSPYNVAKTTSTSGSDATTAAINSPVTNTLMSALPSDMRSVLKLWTRWIDNKGNASSIDANVTACVDAGISLLAEFEIFGVRSSANQYEQNHQKQMQYYTAGNSKIKYKHNATTTIAHWWESSARQDLDCDFCCVWDSGNAYVVSSYYSQGLAPAFKV